MQFCVIRAAWKPLESNHRLPAVTAMESSSISSSDKERQRVWKEFKEELYHNGSEWSLGVRWTTWGGSCVMLCPMWGRDLPGAHWPKRKKFVWCKLSTYHNRRHSRGLSRQYAIKWRNVRALPLWIGWHSANAVTKIEPEPNKKLLGFITAEILCWVCNS